MRRFVRLLCIASAVTIGAALFASPAVAVRDPDASSRSRVAVRAVVHGRDAGTSQRRPTSFDVFAQRTRTTGGARIAAASPAPRTPQSVLGFDTLTDPFSRPSDTIGAVGDTYFVTAVNTQLAVYDRTGLQVVAPIQLDALHPDTTGHFAFDPKVVYDPYNDEFVVAYLVQEDSPRLSLIVTVAIPNATATNPATWCSTSFQGDQVPGTPVTWADYPGLGYDVDRVTITTNEFTFPSTTGQFRGSQVLSIPKVSLYDCTMPAPVPDVFAGSQTQDPNGLPSFTLQPAQTVDLPATSQLLLSAEILGKDSYLVVWRIKTTASGLKLKKGIVPIGRAGLAPYGTQGGGSLNDSDTWWDTGDQRLINAFYDADANQLFAAHVVFKDFRPDAVTGAYAESAVRWYEINPAGKLKNSVLARKGTFGAPEVDTGWPSVATDASGNLFVTYNRASAVTGEFLSAWVAEIPPGSTTATQVLLKPGLATYNFDPGVDRWGDYTGIGRDPVTPSLVATFNQYAVNPQTWQQAVHVVQHV
jgi:hypothetical protein